jgi:structure-specific endonuclease subunit SLX1
MIYTEEHQTYIGATKYVNRRLRQHNKEIVGGARATSIRVSQGLTWKRACYVKNIPDWRSALQIEWRWKQLGRIRFKSTRDPIQRRLKSLKYLLSLEKPTTESIPYLSYSTGPPEIVWESEEFKAQYDVLTVD